MIITLSHKSVSKWIRNACSSWFLELQWDSFLISVLFSRLALPPFELEQLASFLAYGQYLLELNGRRLGALYARNAHLVSFAITLELLRCVYTSLIFLGLLLRQYQYLLFVLVSYLLLHLLLLLIGDGFLFLIIGTFTLTELDQSLEHFHTFNSFFKSLFQLILSILFSPFLFVNSFLSSGVACHVSLPCHRQNQECLCVCNESRVNTSCFKLHFFLIILPQFHIAAHTNGSTPLHSD